MRRDEARALAELVQRTRAAQRAYFSPLTRTPETLRAARRLERELDRMAADILQPERTPALLFEPPSEEGGAHA